jgi:uracil phosphoribosyltransferase
MEKGLRECCRSIRIGKILIQSTDEEAKSVIYAKFPNDINLRKIILLYPITSIYLTYFILPLVIAVSSQNINYFSVICDDKN